MRIETTLEPAVEWATLRQNDINENLNKRDFLSALSQILEDGFSDRERLILFYRFWCDMTFQEIGAQVGLGKVRIAQIYHKTLRKLRFPSRRKRLHYALVDHFVPRTTQTTKMTIFWGSFIINNEK